MKYSTTQGRGNRGGRTPPRIRDLFSKILENLQKKIFFSIGPPPGKNRSPAPAYFYRTDADFLSRIFSFLFLPWEIGIRHNKSRKSVHHLAKEIQKIVPQLPVLVKKEFSWAFFLSFSENSKFE